MKMNQKAKFRIGVLVYLLLCIVLYVCIYVVPKVSDIFVETYVAEYGSLQIGEESEALFVRNERLYTADGGGAIDRVISGGSLMRKGSRIVTVGGQGYYSGEKGIVSYFYDGLESVLTPDTMATADSSFLQKVKQKPQEGDPDYSLRKCVSETASRGDAIFKIVDNSQWYIICWLAKDKAEAYQENSTVLVDFLEGEAPLKMKVSSITLQGDKLQVILSCNRFYTNFQKYRTKACKLIRSDKSGILLETDSITEVNGQKGVFVANKYGGYNFTPVRILSQDGEITVVEKNLYQDEDGNMIETVRNYYEILRSQEKIQELKGSEEHVD